MDKNPGSTSAVGESEDLIASLGHLPKPMGQRFMSLPTRR